MRCDLARLLLTARRPNGRADLSADDVAGLDQHLAGCPTCGSAARRQDAFDTAVAVAMQAVPEPAGLRDRLLTTAAARRGTAVRRTATKWAAGLALVVTVAALGGYGWWAARPPLDVGGIVWRFDAERESAERTVGEWLAGQGLPARLPYDFDYRKFHHAGFAGVQGAKVPMVEFAFADPAGRIERARVLIVSDRQFDTSAAAAAVGSFSTATVVRDAGRFPGVTFVILFTTPTLEPFLAPPPPTA